MFADIIVQTKIPSIGKTYTYRIPEELIPLAKAGKQVVVPFGKKNLDGMILRIHNTTPDFEVKEIKQISPEESLLTEDGLGIALWLSIRYSANFFECITSLIPKETKAKKTSTQKQIPSVLETPLTLTKAQKEVLDTMNDINAKEANKKMLLYGVTGSGKTEIYLQFASKVLQEGKQVLFMVPEISLTPQLIDRFARRFGHNAIAVVHSHITQSKRSLAWEEIRTGEKQVIIGSRSAILSPFKSLGCILIDECHEQSYKQDKNPKYNALDLASYISEVKSIPLVLGSATPLIEQFFAAKHGHLHLLTLPDRISGQFPRSVVIDLKSKDKNSYSIISNELIDEVIKALTKKEQVLLYLNRRGVRSSLICTSCGHTEACPKCAMPLTLHSTKKGILMVCHYCYFTKPLINTCSLCGSKMLKGLGYGTQSILEDATRLFPGHQVIVMDKDTTRRKGAHQEIFNAFEKKKADILIGTQMITKGWDISNVSVTGYLLLDSDLLFPSFRTSERAYQLITQFSGRSGRGEKPGLSIIQTYNPKNPVLQDALQNNYENFYTKEVEIRKRLFYPPFVDLIQVISKDKNEKKALDKLVSFIRAVTDGLDEVFIRDNLILLGPSRCFISKINNDFFMQYTIKVKKDMKNSIENNYPSNTTHYPLQTEEVYTRIAMHNPALATIVRTLNTISRREGVSVNINPFELD